MDKRSKINALSQHFENFNDRIKTDILFNNCMRMLIEEHTDVYGLIEVLIEQNKQLAGVEDETYTV